MAGGRQSEDDPSWGCVCVEWQVWTPHGACWYLSGTQAPVSGQQVFKGLAKAAVLFFP